jgi:hypothetical protein
VSFIKAMAFILLLIGLFSFFGIKPRAFYRDIAKKVFRIETGKTSSLASKVKEAKRNKEKGIPGVIRHAKNTLALMGKDKVFILMAELSIVGTSAGVAVALAVGNIFLVPVSISNFSFPRCWHHHLKMPFHFTNIQVQFSLRKQWVITDSVH